MPEDGAPFKRLAVIGYGGTEVSPEGRQRLVFRRLHKAQQMGAEALKNIAGKPVELADEQDEPQPPSAA